MNPECLDVIAGIGDDAELAADHIAHAGSELGATGPPGEQGRPHENGSPSGSPVKAIPAWLL